MISIVFTDPLQLHHLMTGRRHEVRQKWGRGESWMEWLIVHPSCFSKTVDVLGRGLKHFECFIFIHLESSVEGLWYVHTKHEFSITFASNGSTWLLVCYASQNWSWGASPASSPFSSLLCRSLFNVRLNKGSGLALFTEIKCRSCSRDNYFIINSPDT